MQAATWQPCRKKVSYYRTEYTEKKFLLQEDSNESFLRVHAYMSHREMSITAKTAP